MKVQIDTIEKTLKVEGRVNLREFVRQVKILLPKGLWKKFDLVQDTVIHWQNPIIVDKWYPKTYPAYPYPWFVGTNTDGTTPMLTNGTFCVETSDIGIASDYVGGVDPLTTNSEVPIVEKEKLC